MAELNIKAIRTLLDKAEWEPTEDGDGRTRRVYLGTVFALKPSGKYYTAFASSNVTDEEAQQDEAWTEKAGTELEGIGACLESGEDDPCDLFATQYE